MAMAIAYTQFTPSANAQLLTTPTPVTPSDTQVALVADADCVQQMDDTILGLSIAGVALEGVGLGAEVAAALDPTGIAEAASIGIQVAGFALSTSVFGLQETMAAQDMPDCEATFAGTVEVTAGGINVTGQSIFQNSLGVVGDQEIGGTLITGDALTVQSGGADITGNSSITGDFDVSGHTTLNTLSVTGDADFGGAVTAQELISHTGVSAYDGAIWLGQPNNTGFDAGISLGGGALSGAGTGGTAAQATHQNAMALGNSALATQSGAVAVGLNATSSALDAVSFGTNATASGQAAIASGAGAIASGAGASAYGQLAFASAAGAVAVGQNSSATGVNSIAIGAGASATGSVAVGAGASAANGGAAFGDNSTATGLNSAALGPNATATVANSVAVGNNASVTAANSVAIGANSVADQADTVSIGASGAERRLTNMMDGIDPFDGVNMRQLGDAVERLERGVASTLAHNVDMLPLDRGDTGVAMGAGYYRGETALALRLAHRFDTATDMMFSVGVATAGGDDSTTGQAGFSFRF